MSYLALVPYHCNHSRNSKMAYFVALRCMHTRGDATHAVITMALIRKGQIIHNRIWTDVMMVPMEIMRVTAETFTKRQHISRITAWGSPNDARYCQAPQPCTDELSNRVSVGGITEIDHLIFSLVDLLW